MEAQELAKDLPMLGIYGKIARQILECADFIAHYSETKSAWKRLGKYVFEETDAAVRSYIDVLDNLMQQFRDRAVRDIIIYTAKDLDFSDLEYAAGAGINNSKCCLPGTRETILSDIKSWIHSTREDVPRVFWLSGNPGTGKSAISHTIAKWFDELGCLVACFCFDCTRGADRLHEKILSTIARDLSDRNPLVRRALARAVHDHTTDIAKQWRGLVVEPVGLALGAAVAPALIVIDALDESGEANSRKEILGLLAGKLNTSTPQQIEIPANFRIFVTSRPLEDIRHALDTVPHVKHVSLDNNIPPESTFGDIRRYISNRLEGLRDVFDDADFDALTQKSVGCFEWARFACEYIKNTSRVDLSPRDRFNQALDRTPEAGTHLSDVVYRRILAEIMPEDEREEIVPMFRSVMAQILLSLEPLPMTTLTAMRLHFPYEGDRYDAARVIERLGSLLIGTTGSHIPIRPLHTSFYTFLKDERGSQDFCVNGSSVERDLAFASLRVMEHGLRFNICSLENSYLPNSAIHDLESRVRASISAELSYSCRFWGMHVRATPFEPSLAKEVEAFFDERLLFWLEALALMKVLSISVESLSCIADWFTGPNRDKYMHIITAASDAQALVQTFGDAISHSTPHLYLSALPFSFPQLMISSNFAAKFPRTSHVVDDLIMESLSAARTYHGHVGVMAVAISQDGTRFVCGFYDGRIQLWDRESGKTLGDPLRGHAGTVWSVAISLDGKQIVSGSNDETIRVWNVGTDMVMGDCLQGHTDAVRAVVISPDGTCIVSGSDDKTIRVWNKETGAAFCAPLEGHTGFVLSVAISSDGRRIISGSADNTIRVWDKETGAALCAPLKGHTDWVQSVTLSPDGHRIVSGSRDTTIRLWDVEHGELLGPPILGHTDDVLSVAISPDGIFIVSGSADNTIRVWDAATGEAFCSPFEEHTDYVRSVAISSGGIIVSGSDDKTIRVCDLESLIHPVREMPEISFSSNTVSSASSLEGHSTRASLTKDGWIVGPAGRLLLWIPMNLRPSIKLSDGSFQLDLSSFTHGPSWDKCGE
jgi:WD40 repeat protein